MKKYLMLLLCFALLMPFLGAFASAASNENPNKAPTVVPAIREWKGTKGKYTLKKDARIVLQKSNLISEARKKIIKDYFADMIGFNIDFAEGLPKSGDIFLCDAAKNDTIGSEGYTLEISDSVTIQSNTEQGFFYGIITILQSIYADGYVPCGSAVDYPMYPVRSGMVDVARAYVPLEYVEEITKYMAWFKMNEIHLHINDQGANGYAIFRLESDVKGLTATDGFYTKKDYRDYQKRMLNYGISVLTEIDTPAHSACFSGNVPDEYMFDQYHIDINNPDAVQFIKNLFDEYITGDDPVFVSKKVHFGTDEFPAGYNEQMRAYTNSLIEHINSRGYTPRFWGSFGNEGFNGTTPVSNKSEANFWAVSLSDYKVLFEMGYDIINTCGPVLYVVPGGNYGFVNYYNLSSMYKNWFINYMGTDASTAVAYDNPQLKGASFALWNDRYTEWGGFSIFDIFDRLRGQICFISEKTWCGEQTRTMSADDFVARFNALSKRAGNTNPGRTVDFPVTTDNFSQYKSVGFPYLASIDVLVNEYAPNSSIFYGGDGELYVSSNGKIGFKRDVYNFTFDYRIPKGKWVNIKLYADTRETVLIVDDKYYFEANNTKNPQLLQSSTFVLPLEKIGKNLDGETKNLVVTKNDYDLNIHKMNSNYALNRPVTVSGLEVDYGILNEPLAVDGNHDTRLSFSREKDEQWMIVDLGSERSFDKIIIDFFEHVPEYKVFISSDGENYTEIYHLENGSHGDRKSDKIEFSSTKARYIKYVQLKRHYHSGYNTYYSGGICEFEVFGYNDTPYNDKIDEANSLINLENVDKERILPVKRAANELKNYMKRDVIFDTHINALLESLSVAINEYKNPSPETSDSSSSSASQESSSAEESSDAKPDNKSTSPWVWAGAAAGAVVIAAGAAAIIVKKKKDKNKK